MILICTASKPILCGLLGHRYVSVESGSCSSDQLVDLHLPVTVTSWTPLGREKKLETTWIEVEIGNEFFFRVHCSQDFRGNPISR